MRKIAIFTVLLILVCLPFVAADERVGEKEEKCACPPSLGKAPDFSLKNMEGKEVGLSDMKGSGIILFFWTTWCEICKEHISELNKAYSALKEEGIEFLAIGVGETNRRVRRYIKRIPIDFPVLLDTNEKVGQSYVVLGVPTFIVINRDGYIKFQNHFWPYDYQNYICE